MFTLSPTAGVPGPWWARVTKIPLLWATYKGYRASFVHRLLDQYGPVVVVAPNQIHTNDVVATKIIYSRQAIKTSFYAKMGSWKGVKSTLGILDYPTASTTRNNLIQCFQNRNLELLSEHIGAHVKDFTDAIAVHAEQGKVTEGLFWFRLLALDIVCDALWGESTELITSAVKGNTNSAFLQRFHAFSKYNALRSFIPGLDTFVRLCGPKDLRKMRSDLSDLDLQAREALARWEKGGSKGHNKDVLSMLGNLNEHSDPQKRLPNSHIPAYLVEMLAAGSSTTSTTAAITCHMLSWCPEAQDRLYKELKDAFPDPDKIELREVQPLPFVRACIKETMRLYPVIPGPLERRLGEPVQIDGHTLQKGVVASVAAYTQGRLEDVFPEPLQWKPERWIDASPEELKTMEACWTAFGSGSRSCPGSNLALNELHLMIAAIYRRFKSVKTDKEPEFVLPMVDHFTSAPKNGHINLQFQKRDDPSV